jgi:hypothetical protein
MYRFITKVVRRVRRNKRRTGWLPPLVLAGC